MRLAILYDYLETIGGGERVALTLAKAFDGDLITTGFDPALPGRAGFDGVRIRSLGRLWGGSPLKLIHASWRFARAHLDGYERYVLLGSWAPFAAKGHHPNLYYCLTPNRLFYDLRQTHLSRLRPSRRAIATVWTAAHRALDQRAVHNCNQIVAISETVRNRVRRYYRRDAAVIYPPVVTSRFRFREIGDAWLSVNRLYLEKRIDLQFEIFRRLPGEKLLVVGGYTPGDQTERYIASLKKPTNVTLLGEVPERTLADLYGTCRGFLTTGIDEDFGLTPVEAMAAGKCVLATDEGGYRETVLHGKTGFLLPPTPSAFGETIQRLDDSTLLSMRDACVARAKQFDEAVFLEKMRVAIGNDPSGRREA